ncbi:hypothetical protein [Halobellus ordinarius]|uniref:hypothetical protein n=1 Tax=Halobellus ordinarius TaxID=3075120 RepID=UPI00288017C1|nr:hypothetical protein [Halobellus sp. ZY16]
MPMRQLRSCDFCGDEAAGVYEVIPPELSPTEAEQRRLALCGSCAGTLERTLDPLLARLGVDQGGDRPDANADPARSEPASTSQKAAEAPESPADRESPNELDADFTGDRRSLPSDGSESAPGEPDDASPEEAAAAEGTERLEDGTGSISTPTEAAAPDTNAPSESADDGPSASAAAGTADGDEDSTEAAAPSDGTVNDAPSTADTATDDKPEDFRTVMRLLGNRESPVDRAEIVELAESAYELEEAHIDRILAYAVDRDLIVDDGTTLRTP